MFVREHPIVGVWFAIGVAVTIWRGVRGWRTWEDLVTLALIWPPMLIVGNHLAGQSLSGALLTSLGGTVAIAFGYWQFFESDDERPVRPRVLAGVWATRASRLLQASFVVALPLAVMMAAERTNNAWFRGGEVLYGLTVAALMFTLVISRSTRPTAPSDLPD